MSSFLKSIAVLAIFLSSFFLSVVLQAQTNQDPVISSIPPKQVWNNETYEYVISSYDADGDVVVLTAPTLPGWLSLQADPGGLVTTFVGSGSNTKEDGLGTSSAFSYPSYITIDSDDNLYVSDLGNYQIRKLDPTGRVTTFAGSGSQGFTDGSLLESSFRGLSGLAFDSQGNLFVGDVSRLRKISPEGIVTTLAGNSNQSYSEGTGTDASFFNIYGVAVDSEGNVYVADGGNQRIRKISQEGVVTTFAGSGSMATIDGTGTNASLSTPKGVVIDQNDNLYVAELTGHVIRKITPEGVVSTFAGSGSGTDVDGTGTMASFYFMNRINIDSDGNLYVSSDQTHTVRKIDGNGIVSTIAGSGTAGFQNGEGTLASFNSPRGIARDKSGNLFILDGLNHVVRKISAKGYKLSGNAPSQSGSNPVVLVATDGLNNTSAQNFTIEVNSSAVPRFVSEPLTRIDEEQQYVYLLKAEDRNNGGIEYSSSTLPGWLTLGAYDQGVVSTIAGDGSRSFQDGTGNAASFYNPSDLVVDQSGHIYVADTQNHRIRKITPDGVVSTVAGASRGSADGTGTEAAFNGPTGIEIDASNNLYVVDRENHTIRKVTQAGVVTTFAGAGSPGFQDGNAEEALFSYPRSIVLDDEGNAYITDVSNQRIRKISTNGMVTTLAGTRYSGDTDGTGTDARFNRPFDIDIDSHGNLFVTGNSSKLIRKVTPTGIVTTFAGSGSQGHEDGTGTKASFFSPAGITIDSSDNLYITDQFGYRIRKVSPYGVVSGIAGSGRKGHSNGTGSEADFSTPAGITIDSDGNLYVADSFSSHIRKVSFAITALTGDPAGNLGDHNVTLKASDNGNNSVDQSFTISVVDITAPVFTSAAMVSFPALSMNPVAIIETEDRNPVSYSLGNSHDEVLFSIDPVNGLLSFLTPPDFQTPLDGNQDNIYELELSAFDGANTATQSLMVTVVRNSVNTDPVISSRPVTRVWNDERYESLISTFDLDGDAVGVTATTLPAWLSLNTHPGGVVTTFAGAIAEESGYQNGPSKNALFFNPTHMAVDNEGNFYVSDTGNNRVRKISTSGEVTTLAGSGDITSNDGFGEEAGIDTPRGIVVASTGNIFVADIEGIRKITPEGEVSRFVGRAGGSADGTGTEALFNNPQGLAIDEQDNIYVAGGGNGIVRKVTPQGVVTTLAGSGSFGSADGTGTEASFGYLLDLTLDKDGNLYVISNRRIRKITPSGVVTTLAGSNSSGSHDDVGTRASFASLFGIELGPDDNLYVADFVNDNIRKVTLDGVVTTYAGKEEGGQTVNGPVSSATFHYPVGITFDLAGNMYVMQQPPSSIIRKISGPGYSLSGDASGQSGSHDVVLTAVDGNGGASTQAFTVHVNDTDDPRFLSEPLTEIDEEEEYVYLIETEDNATGGVSLAATNLPAWLSLDTFDQGVVTTIAGNFSRSERDGTGTSASFNSPGAIAIDADGYLYVSSQQANTIRKISPEGVVSTFAGSSAVGFADGTGTDASFGGPTGLALDATGFLYVSDRANSAIRKVSPAGVVTTLAGSGAYGFADGTGTEAQFYFPEDLVIDSSGNLFIADNGNERIRKVTPAGVVTTIAGSGDYGEADGTGTEAQFQRPRAIGIDVEGNLYVSQDAAHTLRKITPEGVVTTLAGTESSGYADGTGTEAAFNNVDGVTVDAGGNIYLSDRYNNRIRKVTPQGVVTTIGGSGGTSFTNGTGTQAVFNTPQGIVLDPSGNLYITDDRRIRKITFSIQALSGNPLGQLGQHDVTLEATSDARGGKTEQTFRVEVKDQTPPEILSVDAFKFNSGGTFPVFQAEATDRNPITYTLGIEKDEALFSIDQQTKLVSFISPPDFQNPQDENMDNVYEIDLEVTDGFNIATQTVTVTVVGNPANTDPVFTSDPGNEVFKGEDYEYLISTSDFEMDPVSLTAVELPGWLKLERERDGLVSTYLGSGLNQIIDGIGTNAAIGGVVTMLIDKNDNLYLGDFTGRIRKVSPQGEVATIIGGGATTFSLNKEFQEGTGTDARLDRPYAMVIDNNGNIYVASHDRIVKIDGSGAVSAFVGSGAYGSTDGTGSGASLGGIRDLTVDMDGNLYFTEEYNHVIRKVTPAGVVTTIAGNGSRAYLDGSGTSASFSNPTGITIDQLGNLFVADRTNYRIRKIDPSGNVTSFVGSGSYGNIDGTGTSAFLSHIVRLEIDKSGNLYAIEEDRRIKKITPDGVVTTFAGGDERGYLDGDLLKSEFSMSNGDIVFDSSGTMLVSDSGNDRIRKVYTDVFRLVGNASGTTGSHSVKLLALDGQGGAKEQHFDINILDQLVPRFLSVPVTEVNSSDEYRYVVGAETSSNESATISAQSLPGWLRLDPYQGGVVSTVIGRRVNLPVEGSTSRVNLQNPGALAFDNQGNLFFIDASEHILRMLTPDNLVYDIAGSLTGEAGFQDGTGTDVRFNWPGYLAIDAAGNIYISDTFNHSIRKVTREGVTTTFAGTGTFGFSEGTGTEAAFGFPDDLAFDSKGNLYVADRSNNRIRVIDPNGVVTTFAGSGENGNEDNANPLLASMSSPKGLAIDSNDNLYFSDTGFGLIRKISAGGGLSTIAGDGQGYSDGFGTDAVFFVPQDLTIDSNDNLFVADLLNNAIRMISPAGEVSTLTGGGEEDFIDGKIELAKFFKPTAVAMSPDGSLYISDQGNRAIRKIDFKDPVLIGDPSGLSGPYDVDLLASAPGGGTATQVFTVNVLDTTPPVFTSPTTAEYKENTDVVAYTALATDLNTVTYSLASTYDGALFNIDTNSGEIRFLTSPDFEAPSDSDADNNYEIEIMASDGLNEASLLAAISVQDARDGALSFTSVPVTSINEGVDYSYEISTNDPDKETIAISASLLPDWLTLSTENSGVVSTYAGDLYSDQLVDFGQITGVAVAKSGKIYIADPSNSLIWVVGLDGVASILAGSGKKGFGDGVGRAAHFVNPSGVVVDSQGDIIVTDIGGNRIRKVTPTGVVSTLAGSGKKGLVNGSLLEAQFNSPEFLVLDDFGNIYLTEFGNHTIRKITPGGIVSTLAGGGSAGYIDGTGTEALFNAPKGLDIDDEGNLYIADRNNRRIRKVTSDGVVSTFAGSGNHIIKDGQGTEAAIPFPYGVAIGPDGNIYVSEFSDHVIRRVSPSGEVTTYAGTGAEDEINGPLDQAAFDSPAGLVFDEQGNLFITEWSGRKLRRISAGANVLKGSPGLKGQYDVRLSADDGQGGTADQIFTIDVQGVTPQLLSILRQSPAQEQIHSTSANFRVIFSEKVTNVDATDFVFNAGGVSQTAFVTKIDDHIYEVVSSELPVGLIDLDLATNHDIQDESGILLSSLLPVSIEETYTNTNQTPQILSTPVTSVDEDQRYTSPIDIKDPDSDIPNITAVTLPDWMTIAGDSPGQIASFVGSSIQGFDDGTGTSASFRNPQGILLDDQGNLYVADTRNNLIRKVSPEGIVTTLAGSGSFGSADGEGTMATFAMPTALALDLDGNLIVADASSGKIRKVTLGGLVSTIAGSGLNGFADGTGTEATFRNPSGVAVSTDGVIYIADTWNHRIRKIDREGVVTTFAGSGDYGYVDGPAAQASFWAPIGLAFDSKGDLYVVDSQNNSIRKIDQSGTVSTFAGGNELGFINGELAEASFYQPSGIHIDTSDNLYIADTENHLIRRISNSGIVTTIAGNGYRGEVGTAESALSVALNRPRGITSDLDGNIFFVEQYSGQIIRIAAGSLAFKGNPLGHVGLHDVSVTFQDSFGAEVTESFMLKVNDVTAPVFTSSTTSQVNENVSGTVYDAEVTDQSSITFSLGSEGDEGAFSIDPVEGYLSFTETPDFEDPADADQDNDYVVEVIATDAEGNFASQMVTITVLDIEEIAPVITVSSTEMPYTNATSFTVDFSLSEEVTGFTIDDLTVVNGLVTNFTGAATAYSVDVSPMADGEVTIDIAAGAMTDLVGNESEAAEQFSIVSDRTTPVITIDISEPAITNAASFRVIFNLSEEVEGFTADDISLDNAVLSDFTGSDLQYSATLTPIADGDIAVGIPDGVMNDLAGNQNDPADPFVITSDRTLPVVTISSDASGVINDASFDITLSLSEVVQGFTVDDIAVVNGTVSGFAGSGTSYTATVTPIADGAVTADIAADQMTDQAGNGNAEATQFSIVSDKTGPVVTISSNASDAINDASFDITLSLSEVVQGFTVDDIAVVNGTVSGFAGSGTSYSATVTTVTEGVVTVDIAADQMTDLAGNGNAEATTFSVEVDQTQPTGILTGPSTLLINEAFTTTIAYSEEVSGLSINDLAVTNAVASDFTAVTEGKKWTVLITPQMDGAVTVSLPEGIASDLAGNTSEATNSLNFTFDGTTPEVTAISRQGDNPLLTTEATFEVTFSEDVTGVDQADFELSTSGTVTATISSVTATDARRYQVTVNQVAGEGSLALNLKADDSITDAAGNVLSVDFAGESYTTNFSPTAITLSSSSLAENNGADAIIGTIAATDADTEDTHTFTLVTGQGSEDNSSFAIDENQLKTLVNFDFETKPSYAIRLKADDGKGGVFEQAFTIEVTNVSEPGLSLEGSLEFGAVGKNESSDLSFTINNTGDGPLEVSGLSFPDGFSSDWTGGTISLGGSQMVTVTFSPTDVKVYSGDITITSTAGTSTISASGEGTLVTSIDDDIITAEEISLYPNPATKLITIDLAAYSGKLVTLTIQDVTGRVRLVKKGVRDSKVTLDLGSYEEGLFILQLSNEKSKVYKKFMIKR